MTGQTNEAQWYIARDGKQHGPLTDVEMRTFVGHSYLRPSDLIWRPGMADWQPAPALFPAAFQQPAAPQANAPGSAARAQPAANAQPGPQSPAGGAGPAMQGGTFGQQAQPQTSADAGLRPTDYAGEQFQEERPRGAVVKRAVTALLIAAVIGGGAYGLVTFKEPLMRLVSGPPKKEAPAPVEQAAKPADAAAPANPETAALEEPSTVVGPDPALIAGSALDARLQKIPVWELLKKEFPDWYITNVAAADKLAAEKKPDVEVATQLVQGLVSLRRENAPKALAASPEKLKNVAAAFLENLRALQAQSVGACYGFISKGEMSPAVLEIMQAPENATSLNAQMAAIFEAISEGAKTPVKHDSANKADYDVLIAELSKLGWKEEDLQVFSNPRLLAKREPAQVCKMVQDWFCRPLGGDRRGSPGSSPLRDPEARRLRLIRHDAVRAQSADHRR